MHEGIIIIDGPLYTSFLFGYRFVFNRAIFGLFLEISPYLTAKYSLGSLVKPIRSMIRQKQEENERRYGYMHMPCELDVCFGRLKDMCAPENPAPLPPFRHVRPFLWQGENNENYP